MAPLREQRQYRGERCRSGLVRRKVCRPYPQQQRPDCVDVRLGEASREAAPQPQEQLRQLRAAADTGATRLHPEQKAPPRLQLRHRVVGWDRPVRRPGPSRRAPNIRHRSVHVLSGADGQERVDAAEESLDELRVGDAGRWWGILRGNGRLATLQRHGRAAAWQRRLPTCPLTRRRRRRGGRAELLETLRPTFLRATAARRGVDALAALHSAVYAGLSAHKGESIRTHVGVDGTRRWQPRAAGSMAVAGKASHAPTRRCTCASSSCTCRTPRSTWASAAACRPPPSAAGCRRRPVHRPPVPDAA